MDVLLEKKNTDVSKISIYQKKQILKGIELIKDKDDYHQLLKIIKKDTKKITKNHSGYWIKLNNLSDKCLLNIIKFLSQKNLKVITL